MTPPKPTPAKQLIVQAKAWAVIDEIGGGYIMSKGECLQIYDDKIDAEFAAKAWGGGWHECQVIEVSITPIVKRRKR